MHKLLSATACAVFSLANCATIATAATNDSTPLKTEAPAGLKFLEKGRDYVISFPPDYGMFTTRKSGVSDTTYVTADGEKRSGKPATWTSSMTIKIFRIAGFGGGDWVLLEHPAAGDDIFKWNAQRRAEAVLAADGQPAGESEAEQTERLAHLKSLTEASIETAQTWVNLGHALTISEVPAKDSRLKWSVDSAKVDSSR